MAVIFDGRKFASEKLDEIAKEAKELEKRGVVPKLVSILVGDDYASRLYVSLKKKAGGRIGVKVDILKFKKNVESTQLINLIKRLNKDKSVHGVMIQLPLPDNFSLRERDEILNTIAREKDVDGLGDNSPFLTPTVIAVLKVIKEATLFIAQQALGSPYKVVVVGPGGFEGKKIVNVLTDMGYKVSGADTATKDLKAVTSKADILISATGSPGIIHSNMVKDGAVVIDIGAPKGDVVTQEFVKRACFISPVPGGVGPVTIAALLGNLVEAAYEQKLGGSRVINP